MTMLKRSRIELAAVLLAVAIIGDSARAQTYTVEVDADSPALTVNNTPIRFMLGFNHGFTNNPNLDSQLVVTNLQPGCWRLSYFCDYDVVQARFPAPRPKITMCLLGRFMAEKTEDGAVAPPAPGTAEWSSWKTDWEHFCREQVRISLGLAPSPYGGTTKPRPVDY